MQLFLLFLPLGVFSLTCPSGYSNGGDGSCYHISPTPASRNQAYDICAADNAYLFDVPNAFQNNGVQQRAGGASRLWLGLTCTQSSQTSCQWDYGLNLTSSSYTNFYAGHPIPDAGPCVYMEVSSGFWLNGDCAQVNMTFGCKYTPNVLAPLCSSSRISDVVTFRSQCYFPVNSYDFYDAVNTCNSHCGKVTSIHSPGENEFVYSLGASYSSYDSYTFTGLQYGPGYFSQDIGSSPTTTPETLSYHWNDSSIVDYTNFGYENPQDGQCVAMALKQDLLKIGQWINTDCNARLTAVCKKDLITGCDLPSTVPATLAPLECTSPYFYSGSGTIYSPGYPLSSNQDNSCEYLISENSGHIASIHFRELNMNYYSNITFYSGITDTVPFKTITYDNQWSSQDVYSPTNIIRMYYYARAENPSSWVADYGSDAPIYSQTPIARTTDHGQWTRSPTTTWNPWLTTASTGSCGGNYFISGTIKSPNYPSNYPQVTRNCTYFLSAEQSITCITFDTFDIRYYDYVTLYDGQDTVDIYSIEMARFTGNDGQSGTYCTSFYRTMTVVFETYSYNFGYVEGFSARFAASAAQLNGSITTAYPYTWKPK